MKILLFIENNVLNSDDLSPVTGVASKVQGWISNGAEVEFVTGIHKFLDLKKVDEAIQKLGVSHPKIHARAEGEKYINIVREVKPNILLENETNSGEEKKVADRLKPEDKVNCIFLTGEKGVDSLPVDKDALRDISEEDGEVVREDAY